MFIITFYIHLGTSDLILPQDNNYYIRPDNTNICINVSAVQDNFVEINETVPLSLAFNNPLDSVEGVQSVTIRIIDDDSKKIILQLFECIIEYC